MKYTVNDFVTVSIDVETDGPVVGVNSMLSIGCAAIDMDKKVLSTYYANLEPIPGGVKDEDTMQFWNNKPLAYKIATYKPKALSVVADEMYFWFSSIKNRYRNSVASAFPSSYDYMWPLYYLGKFGKRMPYGHSAKCIKSYAAGLMKINYKESGKSKIAPVFGDSIKHTHVAIDDAIEQGFMDINLVRFVNNKSYIPYKPYDLTNEDWYKYYKDIFTFE